MTIRQTYTRFASFQNRIETKYVPKIQGIFTAQATAFNAYAKEYGFDRAAAKITDFFPAAPLLPVINEIHFTAAGNYGASVYNQFKTTKGQTTWVHKKDNKAPGQNQLFNTTTEIGNRIVAELRMSLLKNVHGISDTAKDATLKIIQEGNINGWGYDKTAGKIKDQIGSKWRALRIVRTESIKASNMGALEGARMTGFEMMKTWLSADDLRVRGNQAGKYPESEFDHYDISGTTIPLEQQFVLGSRTGASDYMMFPGDPNGQAADIISCRCTLFFTVKRDANNRPVRVRQRAIAA
jgi:hypothetical protein